MFMSAQTLISVSLGLRKFVDTVGRWASLLLVPLVVVTIWDVVCRKFIFLQIWLVENIGPIFESTLLQEMEWHIHTALFALVLGYGYVNNRHVRVDFIRENLSFRTQAWIEFLGCTLFMIPFCVIIIFFAYRYTLDSYLINEQSASLVGLSQRWIIKSVLFIGLIIALLAGIAVWLQTVVVLFGPKDLRFQLMTMDWPEVSEAHREQQRVAVEMQALDKAKPNRAVSES